MIGITFHAHTLCTHHQLGVPGFLKMTKPYPKISQDIPNNSEVFKKVIIPQCFSPQKSENSGKLPSLTHFTWTFLFLTLVQVYIFLECVSVKAIIGHIFQPGARIWSVSVIWGEIEVFNPH